MNENEKIYVLDINGEPLEPTNRNGHVRRLLKENKAKVVKRDPFTIQLLEESNMKTIIVSSKPTKAVKADLKLPINDFLRNASDFDGFMVYLDVDELTEETYKQIKALPYNYKLMFYRDNSASFIKEEIITLNNEQTMVIEKSPIKLSKDIKMNGNIIICGAPGSGKTALAKTIAQQYEDMGASVEYLSATHFLYNEAKGIKPVAEKFKEYNNEMMARFKKMEEQGVNNYTKLNDPSIKVKVLVVDDFDMITISEDYKSVDVIKNALYGLARCSKTTGLLFIVTCQETGKGVFTNALINTTSNKILLGPVINEETPASLFTNDIVLDGKVLNPKAIKLAGFCGVVGSLDYCDENGLQIIRQFKLSDVPEYLNTIQENP